MFRIGSRPGSPSQLRMRIAPPARFRRSLRELLPCCPQACCSSTLSSGVFGHDDQNSQAPWNDRPTTTRGQDSREPEGIEGKHCPKSPFFAQKTRFPFHSCDDVPPCPLEASSRVTTDRYAASSGHAGDSVRLESGSDRAARSSAAGRHLAVAARFEPVSFCAERAIASDPRTAHKDHLVACA